MPFARDAKHLAVLAPGATASRSHWSMQRQCRIIAGLNLADDASDTVIFDKVRPIAIKPAPKGFDQHR